MKLDKVKLVAFAHGEIKGREAEELARAIAKDPEAAAYVEEVRALAKFAMADLGAEPLPKGEGVQPIFRELARRRASAPSERQLWLQGGAVVLVVALLFALVPLRHRFGGSFSHLMSSMNPSGDHVVKGTEDEPREPGPKPRDDPRLVEKDFEALNSRAVLRVGVPHCRFSIPASKPIEKQSRDPKDGTVVRSFLMSTTGSELTVTVGSSPQPLIREEGVEELSHEDSFSYLRRSPGEMILIYYKVPDKISLSYCWARISLDGKFSEEARKFVGVGLEDFVRRLAESMDIQ